MLGADNKTHCLTCAGDMEKESMIRNGYGKLYLCYEQEPRQDGYCDWFTPKNGKLTNCNGTFEIPITRIKRGRHNVAGYRYDVWFKLGGREWHGVTIGDNTQICRVKAVKSKA